MKDIGCEFDVWDEVGYWLVLFIFFLVVAGFCCGWFSCLVVFMFVFLVFLGYSNES